MYDKFLVFLCVCQLSDQVSLIIFFAATIAKSPMYKKSTKILEWWWRAPLQYGILSTKTLRKKPEHQ